MYKKIDPAHHHVYVFIDAANIIYGTRTKQGEDWKLDYEKLFLYLTKRYQADKIFYFGGFDQDKTKQHQFYERLGQIGYKLVLKPTKYFKQKNGLVIRKANCDVDLTFYAMKLLGQYSEMILMSGDGDFHLLLSYLIEKGRSVKVIANGQRTAREIKQLVGEHFTDINRLRDKLRYEKRGRT